jgi:hypothetical protein
MTIAQVLAAYDSFTRKLASGRRAMGIDNRNIRTETTGFVLGGEAWPGAIPVRVSVRR